MQGQICRAAAKQPTTPHNAFSKGRNKQMNTYTCMPGGWCRNIKTHYVQDKHLLWTYKNCFYIVVMVQPCTTWRETTIVLQSKGAKWSPLATTSICMLLSSTMRRKRLWLAPSSICYLFFCFVTWLEHSHLAHSLYISLKGLGHIILWTRGHGGWASWIHTAEAILKKVYSVKVPLVELPKWNHHVPIYLTINLSLGIRIKHCEL